MGDFERSEWHLTIAKEFAALGAKTEASRSLVRALALAEKLAEEHEGMNWGSSGFLEKIAREQVKLGERERAGETLKLAAGWVDRAKKDEIFGNERLELFETQVETKFLAEAERTFDRLWKEASAYEDFFERDGLFDKLLELVRPDERERNERSLDGSASARTISNR